MLTHYSKDPIQVFSNALHRDDNDHKPGGLWLSDESDYGMVCRCVSAVASWYKGLGRRR